MTEDERPYSSFERGLAAARAMLDAAKRPTFPGDKRATIPLIQESDHEPESTPPDVEHRATLTGTDEAGE